MNLILNLIGSILPKLVEKVLTPENVEKYSDKLIAAVRLLVEKLPVELHGTFNAILDIIDDCVGE